MSNYNRNTLTGDLAAVNPELEKIQEAIADQLDRKPAQGQPNQMNAPLDMNSQPLINLPAPTNQNDAARLKDVQAAADTGLPPQDGQDGKFLQTNSEILSWQNVTKTTVGLDQVDNTSDLNKPISTATQAALNTKANISSLGTAAGADVTTSPTDTTSGRVTKVGDFGVGGLGVPSPSDLNDINEGGLYSVESGILNNPSGQLGTLLHVNFRSVNAAAQTFYNLQADQVFYRRELNGVWEPWQELYHTGNLNPNEFGGTGAGRFIATGYASNSATAVFVIQTPLPTVATSITIQGTLFLANQAGSSVVDPATPVLSGIRTIGQTVLTVSTTGLTPGAVYTLRASSANGKLTVNF